MRWPYFPFETTAEGNTPIHYKACPELFYYLIVQPQEREVKQGFDHFLFACCFDVVSVSPGNCHPVVKGRHVATPGFSWVPY